MKILDVRELEVPGVKVLRFARFRDERGYFTETFRHEQLSESFGLNGCSIVQSNESRSRAGVARGLHAQWNPYQGKIVRATLGHLVEIAMDIRLGSPWFGKVALLQMEFDPDGEWDEWIWIPPGFVHGNVFLAESAIEYLCTGAYSPGCEVAIRPQSAGIDWSACDPDLSKDVRRRLGPDALISQKDREGMELEDWAGDPRARWFVYAPGEPFDVKADMASEES